MQAESQTDTSQLFVGELVHQQAMTSERLTLDRNPIIHERKARKSRGKHGHLALSLTACTADAAAAVHLLIVPLWLAHAVAGDTGSNSW